MAFRKLLFILSAFLFTVGAFAEEAASKRWTVDTSAALYNVYMFRGQKLFDAQSLQPSLTGNYDTGMGIVSGNLWMHLSGSNDNDPERFTELDETIKYSNTFGDFGFAVGNVWYTYPDSSDDIDSSKEVFASLSHNSFFTPTLSFYHDYDLYDTNYFELGFSHAFEEIAQGSDATLTPFAAFGFASNAEKIYEDDGLEFVNVGATLTAPIGAASIAPTINYSFKVDDNTINQLWFGVAINYSF